MDHFAVLGIFLCALCVTNPVAVEGKAKFDVPAYFVLGDSLADVGTNNYLPNPIFRANFPPYGETYFHKPTGRFTNGRNIVDFLALKLGLPFAPPFLQPNASFAQGVNFASGGSGLLDTTNPNGSVPISVQLKQYASVIAGLQKDLGADGAKTLISKSIFLVVSGSNDISVVFTSSSQISNYTQYIELVLEAYQNTLLELYASGARKAISIGLEPSGCSPLFRANNPTNPGECISAALSLAIAFNGGLKQLVTGLHEAIPDFNIVYANRYDIATAIIADDKDFGITNVTSGCCGAGLLNTVQCGTPVKPPLEQSLCRRPFKYLYWDFIHPTDHATNIAFKKFWSGDNWTSPINFEALARL